MRAPQLRRPGRGRFVAAFGVTGLAGSLALSLAVFTVGCTPPRYSRDADREVGGILDQYQDKTLAGRAASLQMPAPAHEDAKPPAGEKPVEVEPKKEDPDQPAKAPAEPVLTLRLDLESALSTAIHQSRRFKEQREQLYLSGLGFTLSEFNYGPKFSSTVDYVWNKAESSPSVHTASGSFGVSQLLPTNGTLALSSALSRTYGSGVDPTDVSWGSNVGLSLTQPLLRNAGFDQYRESLTQAERSMVYAVRDFELFRETFVIDIANQFFSLVSRKKQLANQEFQLDKAVKDEEKAMELRRVDRKRDEDVTLASRQKIQVEQQTLDARTDYRRQVESFLVLLGLDPKTTVEIVEEEPPFDPVSFDTESIVEIALHNRLDVQTRRERVEDTERKFRLLRQDFLPDLNFNAAAGLVGAGAAFKDVSPDKWSTNAGLSLTIPLQQINERNLYRAAEIALDQEHRSWDEFLDNTRTDLQSKLRALKNVEQQIDLDRQSIAQENRNVERLELLQNSPDYRSRDLLETRQQLLLSQNRLIDDKAQHFIARLTFFRDLGLLFVDENGQWSIGAPAVEDRK